MMINDANIDESYKSQPIPCFKGSFHIIKPIFKSFQFIGSQSKYRFNSLDSSIEENTYFNRFVNTFIQYGIVGIICGALSYFLLQQLSNSVSGILSNYVSDVQSSHASIQLGVSSHSKSSLLVRIGNYLLKYIPTFQVQVLISALLSVHLNTYLCITIASLSIMILNTLLFSSDVFIRSYAVLGIFFYLYGNFWGQLSHFWLYSYSYLYYNLLSYLSIKSLSNIYSYVMRTVVTIIIPQVYGISNVIRTKIHQFFTSYTYEDVSINLPSRLVSYFYPLLRSWLLDTYNNMTVYIMPHINVLYINSSLYANVIIKTISHLYESYLEYLNIYNVMSWIVLGLMLVYCIVKGLKALRHISKGIMRLMHIYMLASVLIVIYMTLRIVSKVRNPLLSYPGVLMP